MRGPLRQALTLVKAGALGGLASVLLVGVVQTRAPSSVVPDPPAAASPSRGGGTPTELGTGSTARSVQERCAAAAHRSQERPSAVVRTASGRLRVVSFETGWAVYTGRRPGHLVAVCADPDGPSGTTRMGHSDYRDLAERLRD